jgi:hypothetical protein
VGAVDRKFRFAKLKSNTGDVIMDTELTIMLGSLAGTLGILAKDFVPAIKASLSWLVSSGTAKEAAEDWAKVAAFSAIRPALDEKTAAEVWRQLEPQFVDTRPRPQEVTQ